MLFMYVAQSSFTWPGLRQPNHLRAWFILRVAKPPTQLRCAISARWGEGAYINGTVCATGNVFTTDVAGASVCAANEWRAEDPRLLDCLLFAIYNRRWTFPGVVMRRRLGLRRVWAGTITAKSVSRAFVLAVGIALTATSAWPQETFKAVTDKVSYNVGS